MVYYKCTKIFKNILRLYRSVTNKREETALNSKQLRRNLIFNTVGNAVYYVCQWLITAWLVTGTPLGLQLADHGVENAGLLATAATVCNIFINIAGFGMRNYQVSDMDGEFSDREYELSRYITTLLAAALCMGWSIFVGYNDKQLLVVFLFMVFKLLEPLSDVWHGFLQKAERMDVIGIAYVLRGLLSAGGFALALKLTGNLMAALFVMAALSVMVCVVYDYPRAQRVKSQQTQDHLRIVRLLWRCLPLALYTFLNTAGANLPKIFLERLRGVEAAGVYSLVNSPVLILQVGITYLFSPFVTIFTRRLHDRDRAGFLRLTAVVAGVDLAAGIVGVIGVYLFGSFGLGLLYPGNTAVMEQKVLLYPMVLCTVLSCLSIFLCMLLTVLRDMTGLIIANLSGILTAALVSGPMIRRFSLAGASYASSLSMLAQCLLLVLFGLRALNKQTAAGAEKTAENTDTAQTNDSGAEDTDSDNTAVVKSVSDSAESASDTENVPSEDTEKGETDENEL